MKGRYEAVSNEIQRGEITRLKKKKKQELKHLQRNITEECSRNKDDLWNSMIKKIVETSDPKIFWNNTKKLSGTDVINIPNTFDKE